MIIGITGLTLAQNNGAKIGTMGAGKTAISEYLHSNYDFVSMGLMDAGKRVIRELFDFSDEQLWGDLKNTPDPRYIRKYETCEEGTAAVATPVWLTPRFALQQLGTEFARSCFPDLWIANALKIADQLLEAQNGTDLSPVIYTQEDGIVNWTGVAIKGVAFHDIRYVNEFSILKSRQDSKIIRVKRALNEYGDLSNHVGHASEMGLLGLSDDKFDYVINNNGDLEDLYRKVDAMMAVFK